MTIIRRNSGTGHSYWDVDPDTGAEIKVPGVTTLLSDGMPKPALVNWAAEQAAQYAIENWAALGKMGLLLRAKEIQYAWKGTLYGAAAKGTKIHQLAEKLHAGVEVEVPEGLEGHVEACVKFLDEWDVQAVLSETPVVNRAVRYAGTLDLVADLGDGRRWLLDWKTGKGVYADAALQLAAYRHAECYLLDGEEHDMAEVGIQQGGVVHLRADGYDLHPMNITEQAFRLFRHVAYVGGWVKWDKDSGSRIDVFKGKALRPPAVAK